jgi:hypothetical protein
MEKLIARRTSKGYNTNESRALLDEIIGSHAGDNLITALVYNEFATEGQAVKFAAK